MDNVISQAQATLGSLMTQRSTFGGITTKISNVSSRLPTVCITSDITSQAHSMPSYDVHLMDTLLKPYRLTTSSRLSEGRNPWTLSFFHSLHLSVRFSSSSTGCRSRFTRAKVLQCCKFGITLPVQIILIGVCTILVDWMLLRFDCAVRLHYASAADTLNWTVTRVLRLGIATFCLRSWSNWPCLLAPCLPRSGLKVDTAEI